MTGALKYLRNSLWPAVDGNFLSCFSIDKAADNFVKIFKLYLVVSEFHKTKFPLNTISPSNITMKMKTKVSVLILRTLF